MNEQNTNHVRRPMSKGRRILVSLLITIVIGLIYFYVALPPLNLQAGEFYSFVGILCVIYCLSSLVLSGFSVNGGGIREYLRFIRQQCLPAAILFVVLILAAIVGQIISMPVFRASAYRDLLDVQDGNFTTDIAEISFDKIPTLDRDSADFLGDRQMGTLSDMVSQFEYSNRSTQINFEGRPVRVAPIDYAGFIKWFTNRSHGLPAYVVVDMVTQTATVSRLESGMKYSFSEPLNRNVNRHLRFHYPSYIFSSPQFELDENGHPYWIAPRIVKTIGLFGGVDIKGAVLLDAVTGESVYYDAAEVPTWVDNLYNPSLILQQYDYHGTMVHGFLNSIFGQRDVKVSTEGYNYIAMNDDVFMYTGVTSANADQSNLGFLLCNLRTKETKYYSAPGATEYAAMASAQGAVQDLKYQATFPLLLNIADKPTYFIPLKDAANLVKSYAMVNVAQYDVVAIGSTVPECEQRYIQLLNNKGISTPEELPSTTSSGTIAEIRSYVEQGNTFYLICLEDSDVYYLLPVTGNAIAATLNPGDRIILTHAPVEMADDFGILPANTITEVTRNDPAGGNPPAPSVEPPSVLPPAETPGPDDSPSEQGGRN